MEPTKQNPPDASDLPPLGRWGQMYLSSMQINNPSMLAELKASGDLDAVLRSVDELAEAEYQGTLNALMESETPQRAFADRQAQVSRFQRTAEEAARQNVIVPTPEWAQQTTEGYTDENTAEWDQTPLLPKPSM